jgi:hypothetical protein
MDLLETQQESKVRLIDPANQNVPRKQSTGELLKTY